MNSVMICCLGPSASVEVSSSLVRWRHQCEIAAGRKSPLPDTVKLLALRAAGSTVSHQRTMHPNIRHLLGHLVSLFADPGFVHRVTKVEERRRRLSASYVVEVEPEDKKPSGCCAGRPAWKKPEIPASLQHLPASLQKLGTNAEKTKLDLSLEYFRIDDEDLFCSELSELTSVIDVQFVIAMLVLSLMLDGQISRKEWQLMKRACGSCSPPLEPSWGQMCKVVHHFAEGKSVKPSEFMAIIDGSAKADSKYDKCCQSLRSCLDMANIF
mmetsp:Transcript_58841/g.105718  ORF Transcript_58841/g.105718 Transcript_58841/m.105718 type:complete len:268 (-) Transcript_58841:100-903(-)